jgi:hypothetical protein
VFCQGTSVPPANGNRRQCSAKERVFRQQTATDGSVLPRNECSVNERQWRLKIKQCSSLKA